MRIVMSYVQHSERTLHTWTRRRSGGSDLCVLAHLITHAFFGYIESGEYATQQDINIVLDRNLVCLQATDLRIDKERGFKDGYPRPWTCSPPNESTSKGQGRTVASSGAGGAVVGPGRVA